MTKTWSEAASTGAAGPVTEFGWRSLRTLKRRFGGPTVVGPPDDERRICDAIGYDGAIAYPTAGRNQSHDLEVKVGTTLRSPVVDLLPGLYEVKRLSLRPGGKSVDRRFKLGRRGETVYGRRDSDIKWFARALENLLDDCVGSVEFVTESHDFIDQALQRRHGKKFEQRLMRLAKASVAIPQMFIPANVVLSGGVRAQDIKAGLVGLSGIFIIADHIYTLVKPSEYTSFIGFDSASAEGPKLSFQGVVPLESFDKD